MFICEMKAWTGWFPCCVPRATPPGCACFLLLRQAELTVSELIEIVGQSQPRVSPPSEAAGRGRAGGALQGRQLGVLPRRRPRHRRRAGRGRSPPWPIPSLQEADKARLAHVREARAAAAAAYLQGQCGGVGAHPRPACAGKRRGSGHRAASDGQPIENFLDAGTGTGRMLELIAPHADRAVGIDVSPDMLAIARDRLLRGNIHNAQVRLGDTYRLPFPNGAAGNGFDVVLFHQVLHYLDDPGAAVAEAARVMAPGGRLLIADFAPHKRGIPARRICPSPPGLFRSGSGRLVRRRRPGQRRQRNHRAAERKRKTHRQAVARHRQSQSKKEAA